jgi:PEP-CTERM motif
MRRVQIALVFVVGMIGLPSAAQPSPLTYHLMAQVTTNDLAFIGVVAGDAMNLSVTMDPAPVTDGCGISVEIGCYGFAPTTTPFVLSIGPHTFIGSDVFISVGDNVPPPPVQDWFIIVGQIDGSSLPVGLDDSFTLMFASRLNTSAITSDAFVLPTDFSPFELQSLGLGINSRAFSIGIGAASASVAPVPEPTTLSLMLLGLAGVWRARRRFVTRAQVGDRS